MPYYRATYPARTWTDTMSYLTGLLPVAQGVSVFATLKAGAEAARAGGDQRTVGQLMSDLLIARVTGLAETGTPEAAPAVPVTVDIVISDESLAGGHAPAEVSADGVPAEVVPAEVARNLIAQSITQPADSEVISWFRTLYRNRLGRLIVTAQTGALLDQRIAQLAVGGQDPGAQSSVRKLIGVRYRQALAEYTMDVAEGGGLVHNQAVFDFLNTRCLTIAGGTEQILLTVAAERLLGLPR